MRLSAERTRRQVVVTVRVTDREGEWVRDKERVMDLVKGTWQAMDHVRRNVVIRKTDPVVNQRKINY